MNINNLSQFDKMKTLRTNIKEIIGQIKLRIKNLQKSYMQYIKKEKDDFFGLDSLQFQIKLMNLEYENTYKMYTFIENRIYGDYYKLLSMIRAYILRHLQTKQISKIKELQNFDKYIVYKDLENFKKYDFNMIHEVHHDIILIIQGLSDILKENQSDITNNEKKLVQGIKIDNYINSYKFKNESLKIAMGYYNNLLQVFHRYHHEVLEKFFAKIQLSHQQLSETLSDEEMIEKMKLEEESPL